jgi:hypothetical protein
MLLQHHSTYGGRGSAAGVRRVGSLLAPKGVFAFDLYQPNLHYLRTPQTNHLARP